MTIYGIYISMNLKLFKEYILKKECFVLLEVLKYLKSGIKEMKDRI